jgi:carboxyl-terminal processing protease
MQNSNTTKFTFKIPFIIFICLSIGMYFGTKLQKSMQKTEGNHKLQELINLLQNNYVDKINVDSINTVFQQQLNKQSDSLETSAMVKLLTTLDPHTLYIPPVQFTQTNEEMKGEFAGIGVEFNVIKDTIIIANVIKDGPADKANVLVGDRVIKINDSSIANVKISRENIRKLFRGKVNTNLVITTLQNGVSQQKTITRGTIAVPSIDAAYMINKTTGFIKLNKFSFNSYKEFASALQQLKTEGMQQLIFDLRGNGGGSLQDAIEIVDEFIGEDKLIVYTEGLHQKKESYNCTKKGLFETGKLVLLIDEMSASASEVVAGALQDWDRATIIGRRTFGKGLVQRQFRFNDNSGVRITTARYYTPLGRSIQKSYSNGVDKYNEELQKRISGKSMLNADSNKMEIGKLYTTKSGKKVYGGGGISPDYFIAVDTTINYNKTFEKMYDKNVLPDFSFTYYITHKNEFSNFANANIYAKTFNLNYTIWNEFITYCKKDSISVDALTPVQTNFIQLKLKELFARHIWRSKGFYEVINNEDKAVQKAVELLR